MKFERIDDDKLKILLTSEDLKERGLKLADLKYGNKETGDLFQEIIQEAIFECEFDIEEKTVLVEAIPVSFNTIEVIVTKIEEGSIAEEMAGKMDLINKIRERVHTGNKKEPIKKEKSKSAKKVEDILIKFEDLDDVCNASKNIIRYFDGKDKLYKYENEYYLVLHTNTNKIEIEDSFIYNAVREYGEIINNLSYYFIQEHGEIILKEKVVSRLIEV